ncbi:MAG: biotin--[acetyl-CoA-carboxylase] ligase [Flavobacteriaceae bacterium]
MHIVKVDATESTNTFLKEMCQQSTLENFTVVIADEQTKGRGQMHASWQSEKGKNLTFSILIRFSDLKIDQQFYISKIISLSIYDVLSDLLPTKISVKWPNDILSAHQKICGVLIENSVKKTQIKHSVVGIGLNVNQLKFENLPNATSMKIISNTTFDLKIVLQDLIKSIKKHVEILNSKNYQLIDAMYIKHLYKFDTPAMFECDSGKFMGKIVGVSLQGKLQLELESETIKEFGLKEIEFLNQ